MVMPGRSYTSSGGDYRFGFQGQEEDSETGLVSYKYRLEDPRLGRFFSVDPLAWKYNFYSPYAFSGNRLIDAVELEGLEPEGYMYRFAVSVDALLSYGLQLGLDGGKIGVPFSLSGGLGVADASLGGEFTLMYAKYDNETQKLVIYLPFEDNVYADYIVYEYFWNWAFGVYGNGQEISVHDARIQYRGDNEVNRERTFTETTNIGPVYVEESNNNENVFFELGLGAKALRVGIGGVGIEVNVKVDLIKEDEIGSKFKRNKIEVRIPRERDPVDLPKPDYGEDKGK
ncbi:MAG: hypothetical protein H6579_03015 [Chitinophagales bacterium]|nr:hypothetical protein [Chitinophagales bacterium]